MQVAYPKKFLHVMLHKGVEGLPTEAFRELLRGDWFVRELKVIEDTLKGERDGSGAVVTDRGNLVDRFAENVCEEESLEEGVHVACRALILES